MLHVQAPDQFISKKDRKSLMTGSSYQSTKNIAFMYDLNNMFFRNNSNRSQLELGSSQNQVNK